MHLQHKVQTDDLAKWKFPNESFSGFILLMKKLVSLQEVK